MNANIFLEQLDGYFALQDLTSVEPFLEQQLHMASEEQNFNLCITILNEGIGFFRDTSQYEKSLAYCARLLELLRVLEMEGTIPYATSLLNVANALRASGKLQSSLSFHQKVEEIYLAQLPLDDERFASLYNNISLLYQEMGDFSSAVVSLEKALAIIEQIGDGIKIAITHSNLGSSLLNLGKLDEAKAHIMIALDIFHADGDVDFHYGAAVAAMAQAFSMQNDFEHAREYYSIALLEQYKHCGKTDFFYRLLENLHIIEDMLGIIYTAEPSEEDLQAYLSSKILVPEETPFVAEHKLLSGMELSKMYFEEYYPVFVEQFPDLVLYMAFGLIGEGSECFGFDDEYSTDHDFGPGFCIWMPHKLYEQFGTSVQQVYDALPDTYKGFKRSVVNGEHRVGVHDMDQFFSYFTGYPSVESFDLMLAKHPDINPVQFLCECNEAFLACLSNGIIFRDDAMIFTQNRDALLGLFTERYPEYFNHKIALGFSNLAQYGQYNYPRCMKRADYVSAQIALYKFIEECLKVAHYFDKQFPPYYKWLNKSTKTLTKLPIIASLMDAFLDHGDQRFVWNAYHEGKSSLADILLEDKVIGFIECIAKLFIHECQELRLGDFSNLSPSETYLEAYARCISKPMATKDTLVDYLVSLEWSAFDKVQNEGGRADCQNDLSTFTIMRKSQYLTWNIELLKSYIADFEDANARGWNLITEKYGRMMHSTDLRRYEELSIYFAPHSAKQTSLIEQVVAIQVRWMESFASQYPKMAGNSRSIHTYEDTIFNTSYETYLRGELGTYSDATLKLYAAFIISLAKDELNLAKLTMENTAHLYGYQSLDEAESLL